MKKYTYPHNFKKTCPYCGKEFNATSVQIFCCKEHKKMEENRQKFPDGSEYVECKICGFRANELYSHVHFSHKISPDEYIEKFNLKKENLGTASNHRRKSDSQKNAIKEGRHLGFTSENNPSKNKECKNGRNSPFSMNFRGYDGLSIEEKEQKIENLKKLSIVNKKARGNNPTSVEYFIKRGFSKQDAKKMLKERQSTFNLKKCIEKYGKEEGYKRWKERQEKWQNTLNNLPKEEIERIYKAKMFNGRSFSRISQELFNEIYKRLNGKFKEVHYATLNSTSENENNEFMVIDDKTNKKYFLDFYVKDNNKVIEFDGDYWHGEARGNKNRDQEREKNLKRLGFSIFRIKEKDYKMDSEKIINECLEYLNS